jgi:hypothetical protein|nr:MAG TPA: antitoxin [Caudoviricetes sp.]
MSLYTKICLRIVESEYSKVKTLARSRGISASEMIRLLVKRGLDSIENKKQE